MSRVRATLREAGYALVTACEEAVKRGLRGANRTYTGSCELSDRPIRLAVIDSDSGFVQVLSKRLADMEWQFHTLSGPVPPDELVAMRLNAIVVDIALLGPRAWDFLERVTASIPGLGLIVVTQQSTVAQRVRGLRLGADDWVTKPCHPEEVIARVEAVVRRRRRAVARDDAGPVIAGELEIRADRFQALGGCPRAGRCRPACGRAR